MLISYNWLRQLLPALTDSPSNVADLLTSHSFETTISHSFALDPNVTVARIVAIASHPNADRLQLVTVDNGRGEATVVCGAHNIEVGDIVPYSPTGTKLLDDQGRLFTLTSAKIRGVISAGMLNSPRELGLGDSHQGIYILPPDTTPGSSLATPLPPDTILDADITPNRAHDCLSHLGIARELAAIKDYPAPVLTIPPLPTAPAQPWLLDITEQNKVMRYIGIALRDIKIKPSPLWLQAKLWAIGSKPINNVVDITNYVLFETGYPSHAFDSARLPGQTIGVRFAEPDERLTTLDDNEHNLTSQNLVITSSNQPVAVAGVIGGVASQVGDSTREIFLETAVFHPYTIQQSAASLKIETESARHFSKGMTPALVDMAAARAAALLQELADAKVTSYVEYFPSPSEPRQIKFNPRRVSALSGTAISAASIKDALTRLRCQVKGKLNWQVTVPADRLDLTGEHDLIEEVVRLSGLQAIMSHSPRLTNQGPKLPEIAQWREMVRDVLVAHNLTETSNYSFSDSNLEHMLGLAVVNDAALVVSNAVAPEQSHLRQSLLPRLAGNLLTNKAAWRTKFSHKESGVFEIGIVFQTGDGGLVPGVVEQEYAAVALVGESANEPAAHAIVTALCAPFGITNPPADIISILPVPAASPIQRKLGLPVVFIEINLSILLTHASLPPDYTPVSSGPIVVYQSTSKFPPVYRDLSLLVDAPVTSEQIQAIIAQVGGPTVAAVDLFDQYQPIDSSQKGLAFHVAYQAQDRTLNDSEVNSLHNNIIAALQRELKAQLR